MREIFSAAFWRSVWWYMWHPYAPGDSFVMPPEPTPSDCEASAVLTILGKPETFGPCALREGHDGPMHRESGGRSWAALRDGAVSVPREALRGLVRVAEYVAGSEPYPDPVAARRALGALDDAGLLDQFRDDGDG